MRIWLSTAPLAFRLKGAGGGTVNNRNQRQGLHLRNPKTCPNKPGHLCAMNIFILSSDHLDFLTIISYINHDVQ